MNSHLRKDIENLKIRLFRLAAAVEENTRRSLKALRTLSTALADEVVKADIDIDRAEIETEEECLKILALHQPVASDLRFVITVLKINNELEHMGDTAKNIAKRIAFIKAEPPCKIPFNLEQMSSRTLFMLKSSLDAFSMQDSKLAIGVCRDDEIVDSENRECYSNVRRQIAESPESAPSLINYLLVSKSLERMADLCTNIAEDVIYMRHSIIARHNLDKAASQIESEESNDRV